MSNLYNLTKQLHTEFQRVCKAKNIECEINSYFEITPEGIIRNDTDIAIQGTWPNAVPAIQSDQIRQMLIALQYVLGENYKYKLLKESVEANKMLRNNHYSGEVIVSDIFLLDGHLPTPKSQAEALCQNWLDGLNPLIDTNPEQVLGEFLEILKAI